MAIEAIKKIKDVENKADEIVKEAHQQSKEIISKATLQGEEKYKTIVEEAKKNAQEIIEKAVSLGDEESKQIINSSIDKSLQIRNLSQGKIDSAVKIVVERIVNNNGNS